MIEIPTLKNAYQPLNKVRVSLYEIKGAYFLAIRLPSRYVLIDDYVITYAYIHNL